MNSNRWALLILALAQCGLLSSAVAQEDELSLESEISQVKGAPTDTITPEEVTQSAETELPMQAEPVLEAPKPKAASKPAEPAPAPPVSIGSSDEPNLEFERRLFKIFSQSNPIAPERWSEMIGSRREDVYVVQPGDTLWDISKTLFGDGFFWSKLWAENGALENPHVISKGRGVRFMSGNSDVAPGVDVVSEKAVEMIRINALREPRGRAPVYREQALKELTPEELMNQSAIEVDELIPSPEIPPNSRNRRPVLGALPNSFERKMYVEDRSYDITGLDIGRSRSRTVSAEIIANSYLLDREPVSIGTIEEIEVGEKVASIGQNVFLKMKRVATPGEKLMVVLPKGRVRDPMRGAIGPIMEVGGMVQITGVVDDAKNVYRANVINNVNPIMRGSSVVEEPLPRVSFARRGTRLNVDVRVLGGEYDEKRKIIGEGSIIYLDGGAKAGLSAGDLLSVQTRREARRKGTAYPEWRKPIGLIKIVRVEPTVATAVILEAQEEIMPGDRTGGALPEKSRPIRDDFYEESKIENDGGFN